MVLLGVDQCLSRICRCRSQDRRARVTLIQCSAMQTMCSGQGVYCERGTMAVMEMDEHFVAWSKKCFAK